MLYESILQFHTFMQIKKKKNSHVQLQKKLNIDTIA